MAKSWSAQQIGKNVRNAIHEGCKTVQEIQRENGGHAVTSHQHAIPSIPVCFGFEFGVQGPSPTPPTHQLQCIACAAVSLCPEIFSKLCTSPRRAKRDKISWDIGWSGWAAVCMQPKAHARFVAVQHVSRPVCWVTLRRLLFLAAGSPYGSCPGDASSRRNSPS